MRRGLSGGIRRVVLYGAPNVGKSSLFNALLGRRAAAVHDEPGTTRDYVSAAWTVGELRAELIDTAGLGDLVARDPVDDAAQKRAQALIRTADVAVHCIDAASCNETPSPDPDQNSLVALTRADRRPDRRPPAGLIPCSVLTMTGIEEVREAIQARLSASSPADLVVATGVRCRQTLTHAAEALRVALSLVENEAGEELVARQLRDALDALGQVVGAIYTEDLLDRIFSRFCIGK